MIKISVYRNNKNDIYGITANNHGDSIVCAAVSALVLNSVNSLELFTNSEVELDMEENGGYLSFILPNVFKGNTDHDVSLLMESLLLGLKSIENEYQKQLIVKEEVL